MTNLERQIDLAATFVQQTWQSVVRGDMAAPPGAPTLRFDTLDQRNQYADNIVTSDILDMPGSGLIIRDILSLKRIGQMTENGYPAWDMKPMLLGGPKVRFSKKGKRYNIIPFRHGAGSNTQHFRQMPQDIHAAAKELRAATNILGRRVGGEHLVGTEKKYPALVHRFVTSTGRVGSYQRKNGNYEGMIRSEASYGKTAQSRFLTFRVVSEVSDNDSWWHPGRPPQPHIEWVKNYCEPKIKALLLDAAKMDLVSAGSVNIGMTIRG